MMLGQAQVIALLGSSMLARAALANALAERLAAHGWDVRCLDGGLGDEHPADAALRSMTSFEQVAMMATHRDRINEAALGHAVVIVAQPLLMLSMSFRDLSQARQCLDMALAPHSAHPTVHLLLSDEASQEVVALDASLRQALQQARCSYAVLGGSAMRQLEQAMATIDHVLDAPQRLIRVAGAPRWRWLCERCDDGACEHATKG